MGPSENSISGTQNAVRRRVLPRTDQSRGALPCSREVNYISRPQSCCGPNLLGRFGVRSRQTLLPLVFPTPGLNAPLPITPRRTARSFSTPVQSVRRCAARRRFSSRKFEVPPDAHAPPSIGSRQATAPKSRGRKKFQSRQKKHLKKIKNKMNIIPFFFGSSKHDFSGFW